MYICKDMYILNGILVSAPKQLYRNWTMNYSLGTDFTSLCLGCQRNYNYEYICIWKL